MIHRRWKLPDVLIDLKHASSLRLSLQCPHTPVRTLTAVCRLAVVSTFRADRSAGCCRTLCSDCDRTDEVQLSNVTWLVCSSWMNLKKQCTLSQCGKILVSHLISLRCSAMMFCEMFWADVIRLNCCKMTACECAIYLELQTKSLWSLVCMNIAALSWFVAQHWWVLDNVREMKETLRMTKSLAGLQRRGVEEALLTF